MTEPLDDSSSVASDYATILRFSRLAAGLTLDQLAAASGYSASTLSRLAAQDTREDGTRTRLVTWTSVVTLVAQALEAAVALAGRGFG